MRTAHRTNLLFRFAILAVTTSLAAQSGIAQSQSKRAPQAKTPSTPVATGATVIRGGKLLTMTHGVIENGIVVLENGKIAAVGTAGSVSVPTNANVIDATGMTVYPGLIDSQTQLGITEISAVDMSNDLVEASDEIMPHMRVADAFHAESEVIPVTRINGITNAIVAPSSRDSLPGQMSFIQLDGPSADEMLLVRDIAMGLYFGGEQRRNESFERAKFPYTRMGLAAQLRQAFIDAQDYAQKWADYDKKRAGREKTPDPKSDSAKSDSKDDAKKSEKATPPKRDLKFEALLPYLQGKKPVVLTAEEPADVKVAMGLAREFKLKVILSGLVYSQRILDEVAAAKLPVIVGSIYTTPKNNARYDSEYSLPAELQKRGVKIAFASYDSHQARNLPYAAGYAVAYGLPYEEALKALTLYPAQIWGLDAQLGSLDVGKSANVVVANGDPLDVKTDVKHVFIAGREIPLVSRQTQLRDAYSQR